MSRFYVGQRVRIKWSNYWPELNGLEGTIIEPAGVSGRKPFANEKCDWVVRPDGYASPRLPSKDSESGYAWFAPSEDQLEPITDSYDVTSWDSCVWKPEHLRVGV